MMKKKDLKIGMKVMIKSFRKRPEHWNSKGEMDNLMGKEITIKEIKSIYVNVEENNWDWIPSDFQPIVRISKAKTRTVIGVDKDYLFLKYLASENTIKCVNTKIEGSRILIRTKSLSDFRKAHKINEDYMIYVEDDGPVLITEEKEELPTMFYYKFTPEESKKYLEILKGEKNGDME